MGGKQGWLRILELSVERYCQRSNPGNLSYITDINNVLAENFSVLNKRSHIEHIHLYQNLTYNTYLVIFRPQFLSCAAFQ